MKAKKKMSFAKDTKATWICLITLFSFMLSGCIGGIDNNVRSPFAQFELVENKYLPLTFEYPANWVWEFNDRSIPTRMIVLNPQSKPGKESSGSISISGYAYDLHPDAYQTSVDICDSGGEVDLRPEVLFGARTLIADRKIEIDGYRARWITDHDEPFYRSDLNKLVECIVIDAGDRAYTIFAHIALEDVGMDFGQGFYHLVDTLDINPEDK